MAVEGKKYEAGEGEFSKKYGFGLFQILGVNLPNEQLKKQGFYVKEGDEGAERQFITEREGVDVVRLEFACKEVLNEKGEEKEGALLRKFSFFIENKDKESQTNPGSFQWINNQGATSYDGGKGIDGLQGWFKEGRDVRKAKAGEDQFMEFMRSCMAVNFREGGTLGYDVKKFFKGNFKEVQEDLKSDYLVPVVVALTVKEKDVTDDDTGQVEKKEYENFYNKAFAPGSQWKFVQNKKEWGPGDVKKILDKIEGNTGKRAWNKANPDSKKKADYVSPLENMIATMASPSYPCKDRHYFGMVKEYVAGDDFVGSGAVLTETPDY